MTAAAVSYDGTASGLAGKDVQAAIDEAATASSTGLAALDGRVQKVEGKTVSAAEVAFDSSAGPDGPDVQAALQALAATVKAQQAKLDEQGTQIADLTAQLSAVSQCGDGFYEAGDSCIEEVPHPGGNWVIAVGTCGGKSMRLCTFEEFVQGCNVGLQPSDEPEWTGTWADEKLVLTTQQTNPFCGFDSATAVDINSGVRPFRCCHAR